MKLSLLNIEYFYLGKFLLLFLMFFLFMVVFLCKFSFKVYCSGFCEGKTLKNYFDFEIIRRCRRKMSYFLTCNQFSKFYFSVGLLPFFFERMSLLLRNFEICQLLIYFIGKNVFQKISLLPPPVKKLIFLFSNMSLSLSLSLSSSFIKRKLL